MAKKKAKDIINTLSINHEWFVVKKGTYSKFPEDRYICKTNLGNRSFIPGYSSRIVAGFKKGTQAPHLSLQSVPEYVVYKATENLENKELIDLFESMFIDYKEG